MAIKITKIFAVIFSLTFLFIACTKKDTAGKQEFRLYTWSEYFPSDVIHEFEKEHNAIVKVDYVSTNEELLTKVQLSQQSGSGGYDLIVPSEYIVQTMADLKLLKELDRPKLSFLADFEKPYTDTVHSPQWKYSVPIAIGTTGLVLNKKVFPNVKPENISWKDIFENPAYKGKVALLNDTKEVLQAALLANGKKFISASDADLKMAFAYLKAHKGNILTFMDEPRPVIESDECGICMSYSGDAINLSKKNPDLVYFIPKEGATIWADTLAIPANARNIELAYAFINKALSAEGAKRFTENISYKTANIKSRDLLSKEITGNPIIFPGADLLKKLSPVAQRKEQVLLIDREWTELKSH